MLFFSKTSRSSMRLKSPYFDRRRAVSSSNAVSWDVRDDVSADPLAFLAKSRLSSCCSQALGFIRPLMIGAVLRQQIDEHSHFRRQVMAMRINHVHVEFDGLVVR